MWFTAKGRPGLCDFSILWFVLEYEKTVLFNLSNGINNRNYQLSSNTPIFIVFDSDAIFSFIFESMS